MTSMNPFHEGEQTVQQRVGASAAAARNAAVLSNRMMPGAMPFLAQQPLVVLAAADQTGSVWASMLFGEPGFVTAPHNRHVRIDISQSLHVPGDPLWSNLQSPADVGFIALDFSTRRRLRINGRLTRQDQVALIDVQQAYPNCPKYIQRRRFLGHDKQPRAGRVHEGTLLGASEARMLRQSDTFFIATTHAVSGLDCSHRGGNPGFIEVAAQDVIRVPDYAGNSMFNTLGNLTLDPRAGLVLTDFDSGEVLQLSGHVTIEWDVPETEHRTTDVARYWRMKISRWIRSEMPIRPKWEYVDASPFNPVVACPTDVLAR